MNRTQQRRDDIVNRMTTQGRALTVSEIWGWLRWARRSTPESTIRRDLLRLEEVGRIRKSAKVAGGAQSWVAVSGER